MLSLLAILASVLLTSAMVSPATMEDDFSDMEQVADPEVIDDPVLEDEDVPEDVSDPLPQLDQPKLNVRGPIRAKRVRCIKGAEVAVTGREYAWLVDRKLVSGRTAAVYVVRPRDKGHKLSCRITVYGFSDEMTATRDSAQALVAKPVRRPARH